MTKWVYDFAEGSRDTPGAAVPGPLRWTNTSNVSTSLWTTREGSGPIRFRARTGSAA